MSWRPDYDPELADRARRAGILVKPDLVPDDEDRWFSIRDSERELATAPTYDAARTACETLIEDGQAVWLAVIAPDGSEILTAELERGGVVRYRHDDTVRRWAA